MDNQGKDKLKTQDILIEIDNLKKYTNDVSSNIKSDKLESFVDLMNKSITKLQKETENFYNDQFTNIEKEEINEDE